MNRGYGVFSNVYITMKNSMQRGLDGHTISSSNYLFFQEQDDIFNGGSGTIAVLFLDTESTS
jgi:hypothetical protein